VTNAAARLDSLAHLGVRSRRGVAKAKRRGASEGTTGEVLLLERGEIGYGDVLAAARLDWLSGLVPAGHPRGAADELLWESLSPEDAERLRRALARAAQISATAATTAAVLVAIELTITLAWQEPFSYLSAQRAQAGLERELDLKLAGTGLGEPPIDVGFAAEIAEVDARAEMRAERREERRRLERRSRAYAASLETGEAVGRIRMPAISAKSAFVEGTEPEELTVGPGHFADTALPGQGRTTAIAGHRTTFGAPFGRIDELTRGDEIIIELPYGSFTYEVARERVVKPNDYWVTRDTGRDRLVLTTCHPEYSATERLVVVAHLAAATH
jgi:sortase A